MEKSEVTLLNAEEFFATARERYNIMLRRKMGMPQEQWTSDPQFKEWRFCQVHREDDKTTTWFRETLRDPLNNLYKQHVDDLDPSQVERVLPDALYYWSMKIINAAVIFRWFNRIETGEKIKDLILGDWNTEEARNRLWNVSPVVTGAYIIKCGDGLSKLDGVLQAIETAQPFVRYMAKQGYTTLQAAWKDLCGAPFMGGFTSYEVISDLRWTPILDSARDITTWANAGPGCARGLGWVVDNDPDMFRTNPKGQREMLPLMQQLLAMSSSHWPETWRRWEMREVEHWLCEYDKWRRAKEGERMKRRFTL